MTVVDIIDSFGCNSWMMVGDFNDILRDTNKFRGNRINLNRSSLFYNCINHCNLIDLRFRGSEYT